MTDEWARVLVLAPHTDDGEFGCGGTIARLVAEGAAVRYVSLSIPEPQEALRAELDASSKLLGMTSGDRHDFPARRFHEHRQEILQKFIDLWEYWNPSAVLCPSSNDVHQDHQVVVAEARRAFKHTTLLGYQLPWNNYGFDFQAFITLEAQHVEQKISAIGCYESQAHRRYADPEYLRAVVRTNGVSAGADFAEAFEVYRVIA
jgi:LmbE family N-acetylglucosaminyl deacetylase